MGSQREGSFFNPLSEKFQKFFGARKKPLIHSETSRLIYGVFS